MASIPSVQRHISRTSLSVAIALAATMPVDHAAAAPLTQWGTDAFTSTALCSATPNICTGFMFGTDTGGGEGVALAQSSVDNTRGNARALASIDPAAGLAVPTLKAEAYSSPGGNNSAFGTAFAVEGYRNVSATTETFDITITVDGVVIDSTPDDGDTFIRGIAYLFRENEDFFFTSDVGGLREFGVFPEDELTLLLDTTLAIATGTLSITLAPGEAAYLSMFLTAQAQRDGSSADAFSTMTASFAGNTLALGEASQGRSDPPPTPVGVPAPAASALLLAALLGLGARRRA